MPHSNSERFSIYAQEVAIDESTRTAKNKHIEEIVHAYIQACSDCDGDAIAAPIAAPDPSYSGHVGYVRASRTSLWYPTIRERIYARIAE